jgi:hypothetical protein
MFFVPDTIGQSLDKPLIEIIVRSCHAKGLEIHLSENVKKVEETISGFKKMRQALINYAYGTVGDKSKLPVIRYLSTLYAMSLNRFRRISNPDRIYRRGISPGDRFAA